MNNEMIQKIKMCIRTFFNLYGFMPTIQEMVEWTAAPYDVVSEVYQAV